jgi:L-lactate dehydrogenase (cytochrome)
MQWSLEMLGTHRRTFSNIVGHAKGVGDLGSLMSWTNEQFDPKLDWAKSAADPRCLGRQVDPEGHSGRGRRPAAADFGADAIIVSNHGGRQLDGALSSIRMLPSIVRAVGDRTEVWLDSGIRSGQDVLKALAMGAQGHLHRAVLHLRAGRDGRGRGEDRSSR